MAARIPGPAYLWISILVFARYDITSRSHAEVRRALDARA